MHPVPSADDSAREALVLRSPSLPRNVEHAPGVGIDSLADFHYIFARKGAMGVVWLRISP